MRMPFGKHKDKPLAIVPPEYLLWLSAQYWLKQKDGQLYYEVCRLSEIHLRGVVRMLDLERGATKFI